VKYGLDWHLLEDRLNSGHFEQEIMNRSQKDLNIVGNDVGGSI